MNESAPPPHWHGIALVIVGAFCFSLAIPFTRWTHDLATGTIVFWRALFGFLFLLAIVPRFPRAVPVNAYRAALPTLLLLGGAMVITVLSYTYAVQHTTAANAALLVNSAPIYVALLAPLLLHEARPAYTWISVGLALTGMVLIADPARFDLESAEVGGIAAAALSGVGYALVMMISRSLRGRVTGLAQNVWALGMLSLVTLVWTLSTPTDTILANLPVLVPLGVFSLGASYLCYFLGLARTSAQVVSVVSLAEPVFGILMGIMFFAEIPHPLGWLGGGLILGSIYLITR